MLAPDAFEWRRPRPIPRDPKLLPNSLVNHFVKCAKRWVPSEMPKTGLGCGYSAPPVERPVGARHGSKMTRMDSSIDSHLKPGPNLSICMHRGGRANASPLPPCFSGGMGGAVAPPANPMFTLILSGFAISQKFVCVHVSGSSVFGPTCIQNAEAQKADLQHRCNALEHPKHTLS